MHNIIIDITNKMIIIIWKDISKSFFFIISPLYKINSKDGKYSTIKYFLEIIILLMNIKYNRGIEK